MMHIKLTHNNIAWVLIIDDYDYIPEQEETGPSYASGGEPGFPEMIEINKYSLELDYSYRNGSFKSTELVHKINHQLTESDRLCEHLFNIYNRSIYEEALMLYHEELWP